MIPRLWSVAIGGYQPVLTTHKEILESRNGSRIVRINKCLEEQAVSVVDDHVHRLDISEWQYQDLQIFGNQLFIPLDIKLKMYQWNVRSMSPNESEMWKINTKFETQRFSDAEVLMEDARQSIWFLYEMELRARMYEGWITPLSAVIFYPVDKYIKMVCMSAG